MKKSLLITALCLGLAACGHNNPQSDEPQWNKQKTDIVEILYFHGKQRCPTCKAIEKETKELVYTTFAEETRNGKLVFRSLDIDDNEPLADKYQVTWSSLVLVNHDGGKEQSENMTKFAFGNARKHPETFKNRLADRIRKMLN